MNLLQIVVGILLFAAATMVLYLWGLRSSGIWSAPCWANVLHGWCAA